MVLVGTRNADKARYTGHGNQHAVRRTPGREQGIIRRNRRNRLSQLTIKPALPTARHAVCADDMIPLINLLT